MFASMHTNAFVVDICTNVHALQLVQRCTGTLVYCTGRPSQQVCLHEVQVISEGQKQRNDGAVHCH